MTWSDKVLRAASRSARDVLLASRDERGAFCGRLSSSALSTATASIAFQLAADAEPKHEVAQGLAERAREWLREHQNPDGGWGDTTDSPTNISTTTLCWVALGLDPAGCSASERAHRWLAQACGGLTEERLAATIRARYGRDQTFSVPILTTCALGRKLAWHRVPALPFELAACPQEWFHRLGLPMVSYALPALIAIGQARHFHRPTRNPFTRIARNLTRARTLRVLEGVQPTSGGFLEAAPLTSFVAMSLVSMRLHEHPVTVRALGFLRDTVRGDGSWPIDTNLDTWTTTLAVGALGKHEGAESTKRWLLGQQYREVHPYTNAAPGGWAWTDLTGGVPDADDTPGALLALRALDGRDEESRTAAALASRWLLDLANRDGGMPTFCRGWGKLPFDRSSPDLTAHTLRAWAAWRDELPEKLRRRIDRATTAATRYLLGAQRDDGAWVPLWFGNQAEEREENPLYGTTRVVLAVAEVRAPATDRAWVEAGSRALGWIHGTQHDDGGFGAAAGVPPSIEETALALEALSVWLLSDLPKAEWLRGRVARAATWLMRATDDGSRFPAAPIGLYFAKLWYSERLYPVVFTAKALRLAEAALVKTASATTA